MSRGRAVFLHFLSVLFFYCQKLLGGVEAYFKCVRRAHFLFRAEQREIFYQEASSMRKKYLTLIAVLAAMACICCGLFAVCKSDSGAHVHAYKETVVSPTCFEEGYTLHECSCGESYRDNIRAKLSHIFGGWKTIKEPTATETGLKQRTCTRRGCGYQEIEDIPMLIKRTMKSIRGRCYMRLATMKKHLRDLRK